MSARYLYVRRFVDELTAVIERTPRDPYDARHWQYVVFACRLDHSWPSDPAHVLAELLSIQASAGARLPPDIRPRAFRQRSRL
jgi:hypothetical protein